MCYFIDLHFRAFQTQVLVHFSVSFTLARCWDIVGYFQYGGFALSHALASYTDECEGR